MVDEWLEYFWGEILSREPSRIQVAFRELDDQAERLSVIQHLRKMATEEGWAEGQRISAEQALNALVGMIED